jgi:hypothetical protein
VWRLAHHHDGEEAGVSVGIAHPWVTVDTITETVACDRCGKAEYVRDRAAEIFLDVIDAFLKVHKTCRPTGEMFDLNRKDLQ